MAAPERFATRQIPLATRAPSIHGPRRQLVRCNEMSEVEVKAGPKMAHNDEIGPDLAREVPNFFGGFASHQL